MKRRREIPFGAEIGRSGVRFRLWAPSARRVTLKAASAGGELNADLDERGEGWFELTVAGLEVGSSYRYRIDDEIDVPDPASRFNAEGVQGPSQIIDPRSFTWSDAQWRGRPWRDAVVYELHVGAFTSEGTYAAAAQRLDEIKELGFTAVELMPLASFAGRRGWGYDGVLQYAPHPAYGTPDDLKRFVQAAHERELMVLLDVVYNHFGPEGNYLGRYAKDFFTSRHRTPWGDAINFAHPTVRQFFIENALYWIEEHHFDGLRIDAVHAMHDDSPMHFIDELIATVQNGPGRERCVHIVLENDRNEAKRLKSRLAVRPLPNPPPHAGEGEETAQAHSSTFPPLSTGEGREGAQNQSARAPSAHSSSSRPLSTGEGGERSSAFDNAVAQWNDDSHHALHALLTGEKDGYYVDYADQPLALLGRILAEGFGYQGEYSKHGRKPRGEASGALSALSFVDFLQNHDQIGNRAFGERIGRLAAPERLRAAYTVLLLSPHIPMLFMGEEYAAPQPFLYFCDYEGDLAKAVREGRRAEFAGFAAFSDEKVRETIPDPNALETFQRSQLRWEERTRTPHREFLAFIRELLRARAQHIIPRIDEIQTSASTAHTSNTVLEVRWPLSVGGALLMQANLGDAARPIQTPVSTPLYPVARNSDSGVLAPWEVRLSLVPAEQR